MIAQGLRALLGKAAPYFTKAKDATAAFAAANPTAAGAAAVVGPMAAMEAADRMHTSPNEAYRAQQNRFLGNVETHKPHDAYDAYAEDDFMRQAFAMSQNYDQYKKMLLAGMSPSAKSDPEMAEGLFNSSALSEKEYNAIRNSKKHAQYFVENGRQRKLMEDMNNRQWGEGWEGNVEQDQWRKEDAARRAQALQMFQNLDE